MQSLILLTNGYPYGTWETYLETETQYYGKYFDHVYVISLQVRKEHRSIKRMLPDSNFDNFKVDYKPRWVYLLNSFRALWDLNFYKEVLKLIKENRFTIGRFIRLVVFVTRSHYEAAQALHYLGTSVIDESGVLYSYRLEYQPYVAMLIQKKYPGYRIIARGHGSDLFEWRNRDNYIPLRETILSHINKVYLIADDGKRYLENKYPLYAKKMEVSRLGTKEYGFPEIKRKKGYISIVSCSAVVAIKRIDLIVKALATIKDIEVVWTHFGDGPLIDQIKILCGHILPQNIHADFKGFVQNETVLQEYNSGSYQIFLNVSSSEGVPVSIMEVMSFGIPCIATDVGGTGEIITDRKNGILLQADFSISELAEWIRKFADMNEFEFQRYRLNAKGEWYDKYSAERNYESFCSEIAIIGDREQFVNEDSSR